MLLKKKIEMLYNILFIIGNIILEYHNTQIGCFKFLIWYYSNHICNCKDNL